MYARKQTADKQNRPQSRLRNQSSGQSGVGRKAAERKRGGLAQEKSTKETARDRASTKIVEALLFVPAGVFSSVQFHGNLHWTPQILFTAAVLWAWSESCGRGAKREL